MFGAAMDNVMPQNRKEVLPIHRETGPADDIGRAELASDSARGVPGFDRESEVFGTALSGFSVNHVQVENNESDQREDSVAESFRRCSSDNGCAGSPNPPVASSRSAGDSTNGAEGIHATRKLLIGAERLLPTNGPARSSPSVLVLRLACANLTVSDSRPAIWRGVSVSPLAGLVPAPGADLVLSSRPHQVLGQGERWDCLGQISGGALTAFDGSLERLAGGGCDRRRRSAPDTGVPEGWDRNLTGGAAANARLAEYEICAESRSGSWLEFRLIVGTLDRRLEALIIRYGEGDVRDASGGPDRVPAVEVSTGGRGAPHTGALARRSKDRPSKTFRALDVGHLADAADAGSLPDFCRPTPSASSSRAAQRRGFLPAPVSDRYRSDSQRAFGGSAPVLGVKLFDISSSRAGSRRSVALNQPRSAALSSFHRSAVCRENSCAVCCMNVDILKVECFDISSLSVASVCAAAFYLPPRQNLFSATLKLRDFFKPLPWRSKHIRSGEVHATSCPFLICRCSVGAYAHSGTLYVFEILKSQVFSERANDCEKHIQRGEVLGTSCPNAGSAGFSWLQSAPDQADRKFFIFCEFCATLSSSSSASKNIQKAKQCGNSCPGASKEFSGESACDDFVASAILVVNSSECLTEINVQKLPDVSEVISQASSSASITGINPVISPDLGINSGESFTRIIRRIGASPFEQIHLADSSDRDFSVRATFAVVHACNKARPPP